MTHDASVRYLERPDACRNLQRAALDLPVDSLLPEVSRIPLQLSRYLPCRPHLPVRGIFHSSYYRYANTPNVLNVVTVHDFVYEYFAKGVRRVVHCAQKGLAIRRADMILCDSESTRQDLLRFHPATELSKVRVVHLAASESFFPLPECIPLPEELLRAGVSAYVLYVGDRSRYKNFAVAVEAVSRMDGYALVFVGGKAVTMDEKLLLDKQLPGRYTHLAGVTSSELNVLYNKAHCLLYPSSYEGFGIPPLEAMKAGCPVVALDRSSIPEVCDQAALLATCPAYENFLALMMLLHDSATRRHLKDAGFRQASLFSWDKTFAETVACYEELISDKPS